MPNEPNLLQVLFIQFLIVLFPPLSKNPTRPKRNVWPSQQVRRLRTFALETKIFKPLRSSGTTSNSIAENVDSGTEVKNGRLLH